ncbi:nucleotide pyrophosphohydrolase [Methanobrevibacter sp. TMH8]|uniref:nucleotide pyrophosphohydrolase n=1 Tax=Methanobrevibacter sp. TMH8 TaxID=2848611 RepID=UPI001CCD66C9|nr:nucleotide pyrophosphohydrolase [Methanobrevibacter sp. TMH8]MBZ9570576.1 nucleotide pyrophosphohydrolase [Methanobrevibacter sp. TMH8]
MDKNTINKIIKFRDDRNWKQFHTPENLAKSISIEAAELLECFQWDDEYNKSDVLEELADVLIYSISMTDILGVDIDEIINDKIKLNAQKYPLDESK